MDTIQRQLELYVKASRDTFMSMSVCVKTVDIEVLPYLERIALYAFLQVSEFFRLDGEVTQHED